MRVATVKSNSSRTSLANLRNISFGILMSKSESRVLNVHRTR